MSEKRFKLAYEKGNEAIFEDLAHPFPKRLTNREVEKLLNEQQSLIQKQEIQIHHLIYLILEMEETIYETSFERLREIREHHKEYKQELKKRIGRIIDE